VKLAEQQWTIITRVNNAELVFNNFDDLESARSSLRSPG